MPKYQYRILEGGISSFVYAEIHKLSNMKDVEVEELNVQLDRSTLDMFTCFAPYPLN